MSPLFLLLLLTPLSLAHPPLQPNVHLSHPVTRDVPFPLSIRQAPPRCPFQSLICTSPNPLCCPGFCCPPEAPLCSMATGLDICLTESGTSLCVSNTSPSTMVSGTICALNPTLCCTDPDFNLCSSSSPAVCVNSDGFISCGRDNPVPGVECPNETCCPDPQRCCPLEDGNFECCDADTPGAVGTPRPIQTPFPAEPARTPIPVMTEPVPLPEEVESMTPSPSAPASESAVVSPSATPSVEVVVESMAPVASVIPSVEEEGEATEEGGESTGEVIGEEEETDEEEEQTGEGEEETGEGEEETGEAEEGTGEGEEETDEAEEETGEAEEETGEAEEGTGEGEEETGEAEEETGEAEEGGEEEVVGADGASEEAPESPEAEDAEGTAEGDGGEEDDGPICFPGDATVEVRGLGTKRMDEIRLGDWVRTWGEQWEQVELWTHHDGTYSGRRYVRVGLQGGKGVTASAGHMVWVWRCQEGGEECGRRLVAVEGVRVGEEMWVRGEKGEMERVGVETVERGVWGRGLYNPQTASGGMVVDGVWVSCYTKWVGASAAHGLLAPVRAVWRWVGGAVCLSA
eukprot:GFKZ01012190.1.p1 GENE.GFKZ01012190.1~~GFKZ01012190.1.p1  ORF type:complete len:573 (-),score=80.83 GFKZ01012190.1:529-2247(-)